MKKIITTTLLTLYAIRCFAQDKQAVLKVLYTQQDNWNKGDIPAFMEGYWKAEKLSVARFQFRVFSSRFRAFSFQFWAFSFGFLVPAFHLLSFAFYFCLLP